MNICNRQFYLNIPHSNWMINERVFPPLIGGGKSVDFHARAKKGEKCRNGASRCFAHVITKYTGIRYHHYRINRTTDAKHRTDRSRKRTLSHDYALCINRELTGVDRTSRDRYPWARVTLINKNVSRPCAQISFYSALSCHSEMKFALLNWIIKSIPYDINRIINYIIK